MRVIRGVSGVIYIVVGILRLMRGWSDTSQQWIWWSFILAGVLLAISARWPRGAT